MAHRSIQLNKLGTQKCVWICGLILCFFWIPTLHPQAASSNSHPQQPSQQNSSNNIIHINSTLISVPVSVTDAAGHMIQNLRIGDFSIREDGKPVEISTMADGGRAPLNLALLFDLSGSVRSRFEFEQQAASQFLKKIWKPGDAISIIAVNEVPEILLHNCKDLQEALHKLENLLPTQSSTAFFDSVLLAARMLHRSSVPETRLAQIAISDGADNSSDKPMAEVLQELQQLDTMFYAVNPSGASIQLNKVNSRGQQDLAALATATGGTVFVSDQAGDLDAIFDRVVAELRTQYLLGYYSLASDVASTFHSIEVTLPDRPDLKIRARLGYRTDPKK
jgi:Ca-activated chloride channel family protein